MVLAEVIGWDGLIVIAVIALLFGGAKLPSLARSLGAAKGEFEAGLRSGQPDEEGSATGADDRSTAV